jgi:hypothetical protein
MGVELSSLNTKCRRVSETEGTDLTLSRLKLFILRERERERKEESWGGSERH